MLTPHPAAPRILVAEDHALLRAQIVALITRTLPGAVITEAVDGQEALTALDRNGGADVLVSNNHVPHVDGPELICRLRASGATLPIISVSSDPAAAGPARAAGADWFVQKDALAKELPALLRHVLAVVESPAQELRRHL